MAVARIFVHTPRLGREVARVPGSVGGPLRAHERSSRTTQAQRRVAAKRRWLPKRESTEKTTHI